MPARFERRGSHSSLRSSARQGVVLGRCVLQSLGSGSRAPSRLTCTAHFGGGLRDHDGDDGGLGHHTLCGHRAEPPEGQKVDPGLRRFWPLMRPTAFASVRRRPKANYPVIAIGVQSDTFHTLFLRTVWKRSHQVPQFLFTWFDGV